MALKWQRLPLMKKRLQLFLYEVVQLLFLFIHKECNVGSVPGVRKCERKALKIVDFSLTKS